MGQAPKAKIYKSKTQPSHQVHVDLVWVKGECHEGSNKKSIDVGSIPHTRVQDLLAGE